jgi:hypothetical protein
MTWNGGTTNSAVNLYINNIEVDTTDDGAGSFTGPFSGTGGNMQIGAQHLNPGNDYFNGVINDVRIYNRALSAADVTELYNLQSRIFLNKANLNNFHA